MSYFADVNLSVSPGVLMVDGSEYPPRMYMVGGDLCELAFVVNGGALPPMEGKTVFDLIPGHAVYVLRVDEAQAKVLCIMRHIIPE